MDNLLLSLCITIQSNYNSSMPTTACDKALIAYYTNTQMQKDINVLTKQYEDISKTFINDNKTLTYPGILLGSVYNSLQQKDFRLSTLLLYGTNINLDIRPNNIYNYILDWKFNF